MSRSVAAAWFGTCGLDGFETDSGWVVEMKYKAGVLISVYRQMQFRGKDPGYGSSGYTCSAGEPYMAPMTGHKRRDAVCLPGSEPLFSGGVQTGCASLRSPKPLGDCEDSCSTSVGG